MKNHAARRIPGDDALRFLRVGRTQVRDLCRLKLCQLGFPAQDPKYEGVMKSAKTLAENGDLLSDSRCRISGVELCKRLDVFQGFVIYS